ncbi:MAG TPA: hypothetical protein VEA80_13505 [Vitreimonas sp.]|uniref:hypothetical protein n=1 Tax=Vitreimonas sp. TaxID=3069702 RepID=UPI002D336DFD|nr:hypothetical protein [Vitreimonas sp.]HYD88486.1 hypothetical protein [Vitreimonas sp.]
MADKQALNATFYAFRKREKGGVLTMTTIAYLVLTVVSFGLFVALNWAAVTDYIAWYGDLVARAAEGGGQPDPAMMTPPASVMALGPIMFLFQILYYVLAAAYEAACLRWLVRGESKGLFGFSFGADTWRVYFTYWIWFFLGVAVFIAFLIVFGGMIGSIAAVGASGGDASSMGALGLFAPLIVLALLLVMAYFSVRLAPAAATSVARNRFAFFDAWKVTKGRFWALLGSFVLLFLMYFVATMILYGVGAAAFVMGVVGQAGALGSEPTPDEMMTLFMQPQVLIPLAVVCIAGLVGYFVWLIAMFGVNARAAALALEEGKITAEA